MPLLPSFPGSFQREEKREFFPRRMFKVGLYHPLIELKYTIYRSWTTKISVNFPIYFHDLCFYFNCPVEKLSKECCHRYNYFCEDESTEHERLSNIWQWKMKPTILCNHDESYGHQGGLAKESMCCLSNMMSSPLNRFLIVIIYR